VEVPAWLGYCRLC